MKGDFSRLTFNAARHHAGVVHQQGRLWLDADWNEDVAIRLHAMSELTRDVVGHHGGPRDQAGFRIFPPAASDKDTDQLNFRIRNGRYYVDGLTCELAPPVPITVISARTIRVPRALVERVGLRQGDEVDLYRADRPDVPSQLAAVASVDLDELIVTLTEDVHEDLLDARHVRLRRRSFDYRDQPDYPNAEPIVFPSGQTTLHALVYLEAWQQLVTYLEDGSLQEPALGGPDTAARLRTVAQVKVLVLPQGHLPADATEVASLLPRDGGGLLTVMAPGGYTGRDNRLYRVEIHDPGEVAQTHARHRASPPVGSASFKWSHDNASFAIAVVDDPDDRAKLTLQNPRADQLDALTSGTHVEISNAASDLGPGRGHLTTLAEDRDPDWLTVRLADPLPPDFRRDRYLTLRLWHGVGQANGQFDQQATADMDLFDGIHIQFGGSDLKTGDYWQFAARRAGGAVEALTDATPAGIQRHRAPLALLRWQLEDSGARGEPAVTLEHDYREVFAPLTSASSSGRSLTTVVGPHDSLAAAIETLGPGGGVIQLLPGRHELSETVQIFDKHGLTLVGAGSATIVSGPDDAAALAFEGCTRLTLRDFSITAQPRAGRGETESAELGEMEIRDGVVMFTRCRDVSVAGCHVTSPAHRRQVHRACLAFFGIEPQHPPELPPQPGGQRPARRSAARADVARGRWSRVRDAVAARLGGNGEPLPPPAPSAGTPATELAAALAPLAAPSAGSGDLEVARDFTITDCRLYVGPRQIGLLVGGAVGVRVEETALVPLEPSTNLAERPNRRGVIGISCELSDLVTLTNNLIVGFVDAVSISSRRAIVQGNTVRHCGTGIHVENFNRLEVSSNVVEVDLLARRAHRQPGSAIQLASPHGEVVLHDNAFGCDYAARESVPVANVLAHTAQVRGNTFRIANLDDEASLDAAVTVNAHAVTYVSNYSACDTRASSNVVLRGDPFASRPGTIVATANTCVEPFEDRYQGAINRLRGDLEQVRTRGQARGAHEAPISLSAIAGVAVTGQNLLSYRLERDGRGSDSGTVEGVFEPPGS